ncbi:HAD domain-containing protein [Paucimonas lemoignei]|uniref:HAD domain-containing protein n=1 Tax=Paucimonas lemoignei TaxID=29443 RepID=UPI0014044098
MLLFLDFDGVLHPDPCYREVELFAQRPRLEAVLRDFPAVDIVVSSTWRETRSLEQLRAHFSNDIGKRIISVTPYWYELPQLQDVVGNFPRHVEIEGWRRQSGRIWEPWVVIDDRPYWFRPFLKNLIVCDPATGIDDQAEKALRRSLSRP